MRRTIHTMCPMNCHPTLCGMQVTVEDQQLIEITGDPQNPHSQGFLCMRGRAAHEIVGNPKRILTPLRRVGPRGSHQWQPISWEAALEQIVAAIQATDRQRVGIWYGHGAHATGIARPLLMRWGHLAGYQVWNPAIVCWGLGAYGLALTGVLETHTKADLAAHAETIICWGATLASQPTTAPDLIAARRRGARVIAIDCRSSDLAGHADQVVLIRPGTDAALALALCHVIVAEGLTDSAFLEAYTLGYAAFAQHVLAYTPEWAAPITGVPAEVIRQLARQYATAKPAMIVLGGSSIFKHEQGWQVGRAVACLPALTGQLGIAGGGFGPRHRGLTRGDGLTAIDAADRQVPGTYIPSHMPSIAAALAHGLIDVLLIFGSNVLSSFADAQVIEQGLARTKLIVAHEIFSSETVRRAADLVLPGTIWLEEWGLKDTAAHLHLVDQALPPAGESRSLVEVVRLLAHRLGTADVFPWDDTVGYINALLAAQSNGDGQPVTVERIRAAGGSWPRGRLSPVAYPDRRFHTPSGKIEFWSERAVSVGLPPLPVYHSSEFVDDSALDFPLQLAQGRTLSAFHSFYDAGQALPRLARVNQAPELWIHPDDAASRQIADRSWVEMRNQRGQFVAQALVTTKTQPGVVWMRDGWPGMNHLTSGAPAVSVEANGLIHPLHFPGGQAAYHARVEVHPLVDRNRVNDPTGA